MGSLFADSETNPRRPSRPRPGSSATLRQKAVPSNFEPKFFSAAPLSVTQDHTSLERDISQSPEVLASLSSNDTNTRVQAAAHHHEGRETANSFSILPKAGNSISIEPWDETLPSAVAGDANLPIFEADNLNPQLSADLLSENEDLMFADFPEADILEQYLNYTDVFDPSLTELLDVEVTSDLSSKAQDFVHDEAYVFKSPLAWVADWSVENLRNDRKYAEVVEQRVFNLPRTSEIASLVRLYFTHAHHRFPLLSEHYFYLLTDQRHSKGSGRFLEPISLALLYAMMFFACSYLRTESTDPSLIRAIRSMRSEYYSRAATLFKLGCESDNLRQVQICLLLSTYRNYPGQFYENERWLIKAYRILQEAGVLPSQNPDRRFIDQSDWKRVCACWFQRFSNSQIGLKWSHSPDLMEASSFPWHQISLADFQEDFSFSWHLSANIKQQLLKIFVERINLHVHFCQLDKILWKRTASEMITIGESTTAALTQQCDALPAEEIEVRLQKWKRDHEPLLSMAAPADATCLEKRLLQAEKVLTQLTYEYAMSCLYQNTLFIDRPVITKWAAAMLRSSRAALWNSMDSLLRTLKEALDEKLILLLPLNMYVHCFGHFYSMIAKDYAKPLVSRLLVVFVPLTIYSLYLQRVRVFDALAIENLALCSKIAKIMIDLHAGADFYSTTLSNTLVLAEKYRATSSSNESEGMAVESDFASSPVQAEAEKILPDPQLHFLVLRFQTLTLALGRMPNLDAILPKASSHQK
ncbi:uncharacterized protein Z520_05887 [Fonsecaea multimorphosa CBS 102226]|uniref:Transcription factor domain-containing protein n=1 Tax=Fonsecaea multimorphosa CBS 102226 TaxID=1442371 RepID=A0A0D2INI1_9EURO|nr:uncharacterized protein Z520_05887 [Fonsecaea multimorphosa CBS 102226]KIX98586.1 hypothetical protein Z520_05887 [Fonsecaea multimorphosa CBS 102226]OAL24776.1 hypothetical protein AYO22_05565 [Fonsecaea multimorphosa]